MNHGRVGDQEFRWRGGDVSRMEGFSDAVFAFALTLLVVSLQVPNSFWGTHANRSGFCRIRALFYHTGRRIKKQKLLS
ncbi:MAG: DUF1211 domain-containing protein [Aliifodinibius sp.]|nr:DUF1211 domain-containing protein [Fodinibius sp.]